MKMRLLKMVGLLVLSSTLFVCFWSNLLAGNEDEEEMIVSAVNRLLAIAGRTDDELLPREDADNGIAFVIPIGELKMYAFSVKDDDGGYTSINIDNKGVVREITPSSGLFRKMKYPKKKTDEYWGKILKGKENNEDMKSLLAEDDGLYMNSMITSLSLALGGCGKEDLEQMKSRFYIDELPTILKMFGKYRVTHSLQRELNSIPFRHDYIRVIYMAPSMRIYQYTNSVSSVVLGPSSPKITKLESDKSATKFSEKIISSLDRYADDGTYFGLVKSNQLMFVNPMQSLSKNPEHPYWKGKTKKSDAVLSYVVSLEVRSWAGGKADREKNGQFLVCVDAVTGVPLVFEDDRHPVMISRPAAGVKPTTNE